MDPHRGKPFSTTDRDNDGDSSYHCADNYGAAGWWYFESAVNGWNCYNTNPNHRYYFGYWYNFPGGYYNIQYIEMKIRPL